MAPEIADEVGQFLGGGADMLMPGSGRRWRSAVDANDIEILATYIGVGKDINGRHVGVALCLVRAVGFYWMMGGEFAYHKQYREWMLRQMYSGTDRPMAAVRGTKSIMQEVDTEEVHAAFRDGVKSLAEGIVTSKFKWKYHRLRS